MKVALIGASGQAGSRILNELVSRGHTVTAIARHPEKIADLKDISRVKGDAGDPTGLAAILKGHDAVISSVRFVASDHAALTNAVKQSGVARYLVVGGAGSLLSETGQLVLDSPGFPEGARPEATRGLAFLNALRAEKDINWTFLSPAMRFVAGERTGKFRLGSDEIIKMADGQSWISFEDYAIALVDEMETPAHERRRFTVGY